MKLWRVHAYSNYFFKFAWNQMKTKYSRINERGKINTNSDQPFWSISLIYFNYLYICFENGGNIIGEDKHLDTLGNILGNEMNMFFIHGFAHLCARFLWLLLVRQWISFVSVLLSLFHFCSLFNQQRTENSIWLK